ncbi:MAG TPA: hypothetical protein VN213_07500, partial [Solirubrobacteraceae bacterium]|nr:hypothetical protein [Solirubrobacteraceae bacterium]
APAPAPAPVPAPVKAPVVAPAAPTLDKVVAPKRVTLAQARKGVGIVVTTSAPRITARADKGGRVTATRRSGGYRLVFKAGRKAVYKITITVAGGARKVIALDVR